MQAWLPFKQVSLYLDHYICSMMNMLCAFGCTHPHMTKLQEAPPSHTLSPAGQCALHGSTLLNVEQIAAFV